MRNCVLIFQTLSINTKNVMNFHDFDEFHLNSNCKYYTFFNELHQINKIDFF